MKKLLLVSVPAMLALSLSAQSSFSLTDVNQASVVSGSTIVYYVDQATSLETHDFDVHNVSGNNLTVKVRKAVQSFASAGSVFYFCTDQLCYAPSTNLSGNVTLNASSQFLLVTDFTPDNTTGISIVRYSVFNTANPSDSIYFFIEYHVSPTGIADNNVKANIGSPMPNPASSVFNLSYNLGSSYGKGQATIVIYSMLGTIVRTETLEAAEGTFRMDVSALESGVYFASLEVDGKQVSAKRLVISH
ncbi:MAG: Secretion system C-terminal sorting domain [Bacteroidota bacterium]